ncbi:MAG: hypothetical protein O9325_02855 [Roseomonas sp.]|nr:hypothetical protein [Roseomonas sp.]
MRGSLGTPHRAKLSAIAADVLDGRQSFSPTGASGGLPPELPPARDLPLRYLHRQRRRRPIERRRGDARAITRTVLSNHTAASSSMKRLDETSDADARLPARAPFTQASSSAVAALLLQPLDDPEGPAQQREAAARGGGSRVAGAIVPDVPAAELLCAKVKGGKLGNSIPASSRANRRDDAMATGCSTPTTGASSARANPRHLRPSRHAAWPHPTSLIRSRQHVPRAFFICNETVRPDA